MNQSPTIRVSLTFLTAEEGGRTTSTADSPLYRPHLVVGDPHQRVPLHDDQGMCSENYLGVQFMGSGRELLLGVAYEVQLRLVFHPSLDYSQLVVGSTFTVREAGRVVGSGVVLSTDFDGPTDPDDELADAPST